MSRVEQSQFKYCTFESELSHFPNFLMPNRATRSQRDATVAIHKSGKVAKRAAFSLLTALLKLRFSESDKWMSCLATYSALNIVYIYIYIYI